MLRSATAILLLGQLAATMTLADGQLIYQEDFDGPPTPAWDTNNASRYYWDAGFGNPAGAYSVLMYDNTSEYGTVALAAPNGSLLMSVDFYVHEMNWAGDMSIGWYDDSRECFYHDPGIQMFKLSLGVGDLGKGLGLHAWDKNGTKHQTGEYPTSGWEYNKWYNVTFEYDSEQDLLTVEVIDLSTRSITYADSLSGVVGFDTLAHLGVSKVSDTYAPSAFSRGWIDNVAVYNLAAGPAVMMRTPWTPTDQYVGDVPIDHAKIMFSEPMTISESDVSVVTAAGYYVPFTLSGQGTELLTIHFSVPLEDACSYVVAIHDSATGATSGMALDGDGDGVAGGDHVFELRRRLVGDLDGSGTIDFDDIAPFVSLIGTPGCVGY